MSEQSKEVVWGADFPGHATNYRVGCTTVLKRRGKTLLLEHAIEGFGYRTTVPIDECYETKEKAVASILIKLNNAVKYTEERLGKLNVELARAFRESQGEK